MRTSKVNEMMATMKSFSKDKYKKRELLAEMFALQQEIVALTFNGEHASTAELKIWDVERHLEQLNQECGNVADEELQRFKNGSKTLSNLIKAEISGNRGEAKAFRTLQYIRSKNIILKNVELNDDDRRTELDAIVVTPEVITVVEVKNTAKNIFIDENGDYYRTGEYLRWDCNIAKKMALKEDLLKKVLVDGGIEDIQIRSLVVFTDNRIEVQNKYSGIRTCFVSQLAYIIDEYKDSTNMSEEEMEHIEGLIREAECKEAFPLEFDVAQYKKDFATLMVILEEASARAEEPEYEQEVIDEKISVWSVLKGVLTSRYAGYVGSAAATATATFISTVAASLIRKGGVIR